MDMLQGVQRKLASFARERGSALLVSLMVLVGLSLLGLGFVALSETESAIAIHEKNATQVLQVAEAGGLLVVEWFQNPVWARAQNLMPANTNAIKVQRLVTKPGSPTAVAVGYYKLSAGTLLFDKPFKGDDEHRLYGTEDNPDVLINDKTNAAFMTAFNIALFNTNPTPGVVGNECTGCDNNEGGRVTEIRVYAPPVDQGVLNTEIGWNDPVNTGIPQGTGFIYGGARFGLATIRVTAAKFNAPDCGPYKAGCRIVAQRTSKFVISEWPFPGPSGPVQSNANISTTGNLQVHWGKITSTGTTTLKRPYVSIPWHDAYNQAAIERGYETAANGGSPTDPALVFPTDPASVDYLRNENWLWEQIGRTFEDPWYYVRARGTMAEMSNPADPHQYRYRNATLDPSDPVCNPCTAAKAATPGQSNFFQLQTVNQAPDQVDSLFPRVDYNFWKQVAVSADGQNNVYYLRWIAADTFSDRSGNVRSFRQWIDTASNPPAGTGPKSVPGFYFFDTQNGLNPQNSGGGILTPDVQVNGGRVTAKGFIYLNAATFSTKGLAGNGGWYSMPGEYYRNIGYREVDDSVAGGPWKEAVAGVPCDPLVPTTCVMAGNTNKKWDFQDLSIGANPNNDKFDVVVQRNTAALPRDSAAAIAANAEWFPIPYFPGCNPGVTCSEPHEPYLNFIYPDTVPNGITVRWHDPNAGAITTFRKPKLLAGAVPVTCTAASTPEQCTSNAYDRDGPLVQLDSGNGAWLEGVFYTEGAFETTGNAHYFGSVLVQGDASKAGNPDIWFDERLVKGEWPPGNFGFPRAYITTQETDQ